MYIQIENPCNANWKTMSPTENGRFCSECKTCVYDFSKNNMPFHALEREATCGNFKALDLYHPFGDIRDQWIQKYQDLKQRTRLSKTWLIPLLAMLCLVWASGCTKHIRGRFAVPKHKQSPKTQTKVYSKNKKTPL